MNSNGKTAISTLDDESIGFVSWYAEGEKLEPLVTTVLYHFTAAKDMRRNRFSWQKINLRAKYISLRLQLQITRLFSLPVERTSRVASLKLSGVKRMRTEDWSSFIMSACENRIFEPAASQYSQL